MNQRRIWPHERYHVVVRMADYMGKGYPPYPEGAQWPGVTITVMTQDSREVKWTGERVHDVIAGWRYNAPTKEVYEPETRNSIGGQGAYRTTWPDEETMHAWVQGRVNRLVERADRIQSGEPIDAFAEI